MGGVWGGFRIEFQTTGRRRPLLRLMFGVEFPVWMASTVLLCQNTLARLWTVAPSHAVDAMV